MNKSNNVHIIVNFKEYNIFIVFKKYKTGVFIWFIIKHKLTNLSFFPGTFLYRPPDVSPYVSKYIFNVDLKGFRVH